MFVEKKTSSVGKNNPFTLPAKQADNFGAIFTFGTASGASTASGVAQGSSPYITIIPQSGPLPQVEQERIQSGINKFEQAVEISKSKA